MVASFPFTPSGSDTALSRLGRDLVFTLSAELDGLGGIRVVDPHTVLAHGKPGDLATPAAGADWARQFGAGSIVSGSLVREGDDCHGIRRLTERMLEERFGITHTTLQVDHEHAEALLTISPPSSR